MRSDPLSYCSSIWAEALSLIDSKENAATLYFRNRAIEDATSIPELKEALKLHPKLDYFGEERKESFPAILAKVVEFSDGEFKMRGLQRIYLGHEGQKAPVPSSKKAIGEILGHGVWLGEPNSKIAVCEGIETALSIFVSTGITSVAAISANGMKQFKIPKFVKEVLICADKDNSEIGLKAALELKLRADKGNIQCRIVLPPQDIPQGSKGVDFNDLLKDQGKTAVLNAISLSDCYYSDTLSSPDDPEYPDDIEDFQPTLHEAALVGPLGEICLALSPETEASLNAILFTLVAGIGNILSNKVYCEIEGSKHYLKIFSILVGPSSVGRKGTAVSRAMQVLKMVDPLWRQNCIASGLTTYEGLASHFIDRATNTEKIEKRLFCLEEEFASVLKKFQREGNTLSMGLRSAFDQDTFQILTRSEPIKVANAKISLIANITPAEFIQNAKAVEFSNGLLNRFLFCWSVRDKLLPFGGDDITPVLKNLVGKLQSNIASLGDICRIEFGLGIRPHWIEAYHSLNQPVSGKVGQLASRGPVYVRRLSAIFAAVEGEKKVEVRHLNAALAMWEYSSLTAKFLIGSEISDPNLSKLLKAIQDSGDGLNRTEISRVFGGHKNKTEIDSFLTSLTKQGMIKVIDGKLPSGRMSCRWVHFDYLRIAKNAKCAKLESSDIEVSQISPNSRFAADPES